MSSPDAFFEYGGDLPYNEIIRRRVDALFEANPEKVLPPADRLGGERLHFIVETPSTTASGLSPDESYVIPTIYTPYVAERSALFGCSLTQDHAAQIAAGPTEADAKEAAARRAWLSEIFYTGATDTIPEARLEIRWNRGREDRGTQTDVLGPGFYDREILESWHSIVVAAKVYDPRTHGIVRAPARPNGLRTGPDYLAPLAEVVNHQREVYRASLPGWRRFAGILVPSLVTPPPLNG